MGMRVHHCNPGPGTVPGARVCAPGMVKQPLTPTRKCAPVTKAKEQEQTSCNPSLVQRGKHAMRVSACARGAGPGSHWCEHVGRAHKSNRVFFVVSLAEGRYAQKCHDPDCAHFRSAWMPLPPHLRLRRAAA